MQSQEEALLHAPSPRFECLLRVSRLIKGRFSGGVPPGGGLSVRVGGVGVFWGDLIFFFTFTRGAYHVVFCFTRQSFRMFSPLRARILDIRYEILDMRCEILGSAFEVVCVSSACEVFVSVFSRSSACEAYFSFSNRVR